MSNDLVQILFSRRFNVENFKTLTQRIIDIDEILDLDITDEIEDIYKDKVEKITMVGKDENSKISIYIVEVKNARTLIRARTMLRNVIAKRLKEEHLDGAIVAYFNPDSPSWRFSFIRRTLAVVDNSLQEIISPAKRYSYIVGEGENIHTAVRRISELVEQDNITVDIIEEAFSVEKVTEEFYKEIQKQFYKLVGGKIRDGNRNILLKGVLSLPGKNCSNENNRNLCVNFAVRLLGRLIFIWFLKKKNVFSNLVVLSTDAIKNEEYNNILDINGSFYNSILEPLFFEVLNTHIKDRKKWIKESILDNVPYLNGGLFEPHEEDFYGKEEYVSIPDEWFVDLFEVFERFNFTVDESTSVDIEVSVDPEMLGRIFENLLAEISPDTEKSAKKLTGSFYTPRRVVDYMNRNILKHYIYDNVNISKEKIEIIFSPFSSNIESMFTDSEKKELIDFIYNIKILDPAIGSGAFPVGMLQLILEILDKIDPNAKLWFEKSIDNISEPELKKHLKEKYKEENLNYIRKLILIRRILYGVDILPIAVEVSRLRFFLSLIVDEKFDGDENDNFGIQSLPNLEFKIISANTLIRVDDSVFERIEEIKKMKDIIHQYFSAHQAEKTKLKEEYNKLKEELEHIVKKQRQVEHWAYEYVISWDPFRNERPAEFFSPYVMFGGIKEFDVVIGNPPYVSNKTITNEQMEIYEHLYRMRDDLYNYFITRGYELLKDNGYMSYITSNTYFTINSKLNIRELFIRNKLIEIYKTGYVFEAMVDTAIFLLKKEITLDNDTDPVNYDVIFKTISKQEEFDNPHVYKESINTYRNALHKVFFIPNKLNKQIYSKYNEIVNKLYREKWFMISTSKNINKYKGTLNEYRKNLKPGDITLLGLITDGGVGLQTGDNGKYIGVLEGTTYADKVRESRPEKLFNAIINYNIKELSFLKSKKDTIEYLESMGEKEIRKLFDDLKEKYGRDILGQGYLYRIVSKDEIADIDALSDDEKLNGISENKTFVPYEKGDKEGNRWYAPTPYYIDWSRKNVKLLKDNSGKKGIGMPVVRNPQFYFREGFCWTDVSDERLRVRIKEKGIHDVLSMSLFSLMKSVPDWYLVTLLNSSFFGVYVSNFINSTCHFQMNNARVLPIIIPDKFQLEIFRDIFVEAYTMQKNKFAGKISEEEAKIILDKVQKKLDEEVYKLYGLNI